VGVVKSSRQDVPLLATPTGTTRALQEVAIRARVRGFLTERHFEEGSFVKKGQLLMVIEEEPYKIARDTAIAKRNEARAALEKAENSKAREIAAARLTLDQAQLLLAQVEERRARALLSRNAGSREEFDKAEAERKKDEAQIEADKANLEQSKTDYDVNILAAKAQLEAAESAVRDAELNLSYCRMYAPFPGRIGEAKIKVGNLVGPVSAEGLDLTTLATIQQLDPMGVDVQVSSRYLDRATALINRGKAYYRLTRPGIDGEQVHPYVGECYFIDNTIDPTTSTFLVRGRISNPQNTLLPGEYVKLKIVVDEVKGAIVVPEQAVIETQAGPVVYIVDGEGKVAIQRVEAAQTYQGTRIIPKGLDAGVTVIVEGLQLIRPGIKVRTEPANLALQIQNEANPETTPPAKSGPSPDQTRPATKAKSDEAQAPTPGGPRSAVKAAEDELPETPIAPESPRQ
jgi:RND family efflux transporter MFP subunit